MKELEMKLFKKTIAVAVMGLTSASVFAVELISADSNVPARFNQTIKIETPFLDPGVIAPAAFDVSMDRQFVSIRSAMSGDVYFFDRSSKPNGQMAAYKIPFVSFNSEEKVPSEYKIAPSYPRHDFQSNSFIKSK